MRLYQRLVRPPGLHRLFDLALRPANRLILNQDWHEFQTRTPKRSDLRMDEKLIPGDGPIIAYRRRRSELRGEADTKADA